MTWVWWHMSAIASRSCGAARSSRRWQAATWRRVRCSIPIADSCIWRARAMIQPSSLSSRTASTSYGPAESLLRLVVDLLPILAVRWRLLLLERAQLPDAESEHAAENQNDLDQ